MRVVSPEQIRVALDVDAATAAIEEGYKAYSAGRATVPPVGYLGFDRPRGDCHIKYGHIEGAEHFVVKVATGFYENPARGLPSSNGFMVILSAHTGEPLALFDDGGFLTDVRTAIAGLIAAKVLARQQPKRIGIVGAGIQAGLQLQYLLRHFGSRPVDVWARDAVKATRFSEDRKLQGLDITVAGSVQSLCERCDLIVTTTPSSEPLIFAEWLQPGTHITAVGADAEGKQELHVDVFRRADVCAVDSVSQCVDHGDASHAIAAGAVKAENLRELGSILAGEKAGRIRDSEITLADLTGLAVQDIQIADSIWNKVQTS